MTRFSQMLASLAHRVRQSVAKLKERRFLWLLVLLVTTMYASLSILRHLHFTSTAYDLGIFDQAVWQYSKFNLPYSSVRSNLLTENLLGDHFHPILALLAPLYWLVDSVIALLVAQALLFATAIVPIFLFTEKRLGKVAAYLFALSYAIFWGIQNAVEFDFHEIAFAVPLIALAIYFIDEKKWTAYFVCLALLLLTKENLSILVFFFGVYLIVLRQFKRGLISMGAGVVWFFAAVKILIPLFIEPLTATGERRFYRYWNYSRFGADPWSAFVTVIKNPLLLIETFVSPRVKLHTYWYIFHPFLFLSFISPVFILAIPLLAERFLSDGEHFWGTNYHYTAVLAPILVMTSVDGLARIARQLKGSKATWLIISASSIVLLLNLLLIPKFPLWDLTTPSHWQLSRSDTIGRRAISLIPPDASVLAQGPIAPHLSHRRMIYVLHQTVTLPDSDFIVASSRVNPFPFSSYEEIQRFLAVQETRGYSRIFEEDGWVVLKAGDLIGAPNSPYNNSAFVDQSAPMSMKAGETYDVYVSMRNTGIERWTSDKFYRLAFLSGPPVWGLERVELPATVEPGADVRFSFTVKAPLKPGVYSFHWGMVKDGVAAFGENAPELRIDVSAPAASP